MITFKKITWKSKAGSVLINYSHAILDQEIQNNGGCPEAAGPDRERFLQPRKYHRSWIGNWLWPFIVEIQGYCYLKYREYLQKLYSSDTWWLTEQANVLKSEKKSIFFINLYKNRALYGSHGNRYRMVRKICTCQKNIIWISGYHYMILWKGYQNVEAIFGVIHQHIRNGIPSHHSYFLQQFYCVMSNTTHNTYNISQELGTKIAHGYVFLWLKINCFNHKNKKCLFYGTYCTSQSFQSACQWPKPQIYFPGHNMKTSQIPMVLHSIARVWGQHWHT